MVVLKDRLLTDSVLLQVSERDARVTEGMRGFVRLPTPTTATVKRQHVKVALAAPPHAALVLYIVGRSAGPVQIDTEWERRKIMGQKNSLHLRAWMACMAVSEVDL